jgi:homocysteine S-methyltransferase
MLETIERMEAVTRARLSAQPNAGRPRDIEGRNIYLASPEYLASYSRRFVSHGVRLVGGCCGTTPEHIRQIKNAVKASAGQAAHAHARTVVKPRAVPDPGVQLVPPAQRSPFARTLAEGRFATIVQLSPPRGYASEATVEQACALKARGVDAVLIPDGQRGSRMSALSLAVLVQQKACVEALLQYSCRDRNLLGMQSDLLGAHAMGIRNVLIVTGDVRTVGDYPDATAVFDVDSIGLTNVVTRLNHGLDIGGQSIGSATAFEVGVQINPGAEDLDSEVRRFAYKVEAGAEFAVTKPVFDVETFERFLRRIQPVPIPVILGLWPFESALNAEFMANEVPGVRVPRTVLDRMRAAGSAEAEAAEGVAIAREIGSALRTRVQGVHIAAPSGSTDAAIQVLEGIQSVV